MLRDRPPPPPQRRSNGCYGAAGQWVPGVNVTRWCEEMTTCATDGEARTFARTKRRLCRVCRVGRGEKDHLVGSGGSVGRGPPLRLGLSVFFLSFCRSWRRATRATILLRVATLAMSAINKRLGTLPLVSRTAGSADDFILSARDRGPCVCNLTDDTSPLDSCLEFAKGVVIRLVC